jgi:hypothetical protein
LRRWQSSALGLDDQRFDPEHVTTRRQAFRDPVGDCSIESSGMEHVVFFVGALLILVVNGLAIVVLSTFRRLTYANALPSPIIGTCVLSILTTILYRWDVPVHITMLCATAISSATVLAFPLWIRGAYGTDASNRVDIIIRTVCFLVVIVLILSPHYLGVERFAVFQGNRHDAVNYLTGAFGFANYTYSYLKSLDVGTESAAGLLSASQMLGERPSVSLLYAAFNKLFSDDFLSNAYEYCSIGQLNFYFAFLYFVLAIFPNRQRVAHIASAAFAVGFFGQYIFDINAWSELFAVPVLLVFFTDYCRSLLFSQAADDFGDREAQVAGDDVKELRMRRHAKSVFIFLRLPVSSAGLFFLYPEISPVAGVACGGALMFTVASDVMHGNRNAVMKAMRTSAVLAVLILLIASGYWNGTAKFFLKQLHMATAVKVNWQYAFQAYLLGGGPEVSHQINSATGSDYLFYALIAAPGTFLAGFMGLYFLQPQHIWTKPWDFLHLFISLGLLLGFVTIVSGVVFAFRDEFSNRMKRKSLFRLLAVGAFLTFIIPVGLFFKGQYWAAGKGLSMLCPFVFVALILPILTQRGNRLILALVWMAVCGHVLFGVSRPIVVASRGDGTGFGYPYPSMAAVYKAGVDWEIMRYGSDIEKCSLVKIDIHEPFLERIVENFVMEKKIAWFSPNQQWSYYGELVKLPARNPPEGKQEDCQIITKSDAGSREKNTIVLDRER